MAECSFSRCVQERRLIKKELQRWTKNMVAVVGLERVAEELMGRRKWKQCQNVAICHSRIDDHFNDVDNQTKDWTPVDKCCLCNESTYLDRPPSPGTDQESSSNDSIYRESLPATPPPSAPPPAPAMTAFESVKLAAIAALTRGGDAPPMPPASMFYPQGHFTPWYLAPTLPPQHQHMAARSRPIDVVPEEAHVEMPLDLSASRQPPPQPPPIHHMDNKQIYKAKPRMSAVSGRRTYTEDELQAALRDIQSGKLGTRRAAVIYGIPRSTLRNKVYKLAMERERDAQLLLNAPPVVKVDEEDKELSGAEEEREVEKALRKPLLSMEDLVRFSMLESNGLANSDAIRALLQQGKAFPQGDVWGGLEHSALGPYISQLLAAKTQQESREQGDFLPKFSPPPLLPELVRRMMAEEKMMDERLKRASANGTEERSLAADDPASDAEAASSNVILKIPSFKPTTSKNGVNSEPFPSPSQESSSQPFNGDSRSPPSMMGKGIGVSLRDVIAKSINEKFKQGGETAPIPLSQKLLMSPEVESPYKRSRYSPPLSAHSMIKHNNNNHHMDDRNMQKMSPKSASMMSSNSGSGGKGTRPKRGKYRNYDRDSLVEAVRAVQRGEMSVHRAGSYYGVPHSTLEYKVKERHLMRPRKRDPKPPTDEKRKEDLRLSQDKPGLGPPTLLKPPYVTSPLQNTPNGLKIPPMFDPAMSPLAYSTPPPFPFWRPNPFYSLPMPDFPPGHSAQEQFIASQMMQRLQEESARIPPIVMHTSPAEPPLGKSARKIAESLYDGTGTNGTFLDGIIRSSLEMGLPSSAPKECGPSERTPENLSNKALLDQLCRNSRITPLPVHDGSTSDDDSIKRSSTCGKDDSERNMDFSPSSEASSRQRKLTDNADDDFYAKSPKDNFSDNDSPSKDSNDEFSDNEEDRIEDESACDSKHDLQKRDDEAAKDREKQEPEENKDQTMDTKSNLNS